MFKKRREQLDRIESRLEAIEVHLGKIEGLLFEVRMTQLEAAKKPLSEQDMIRQSFHDAIKRASRCGDVNDLVKAVNALKSMGGIKKDSDR